MKAEPSKLNSMFQFPAYSTHDLGQVSCSPHCPPSTVFYQVILKIPGSLKNKLKCDHLEAKPHYSTGSMLIGDFPTNTFESKEET